MAWKLKPTSPEEFTPMFIEGLLADCLAGRSMSFLFCRFLRPDCSIIEYTALVLQRVNCQLPIFARILQQPVSARSSGAGRHYPTEAEISAARSTAGTTLQESSWTRVCAGTRARSDTQPWPSISTPSTALAHVHALYICYCTCTSTRTYTYEYIHKFYVLVR